MRRRLAASLLATMLVANSTAFAASIEVIQAKVSVNTGGGFHEIKTTTEVQPGHIVITGPSGSARIFYSEACFEDIVPIEVFVVPQDPNCNPGVMTHDRLHGLEYEHYVLGGLLVGGTIAGIVALTRHENDKPDEPRSP